jgi:nucleoside phosphorylase
MIVSEIIKTYYVLLVINVGRCQGLSHDMKVGEVAISRQVYLGEVSLLDINNSLLAQVPGFPQYHLCDHYVLNMMQDVFNRVSSKQNAHVAVFVSLEKYFDADHQIDYLTKDGTMFGVNRYLVIDNTSGGIALACAIHDIPMISVKVIEAYVGEKRTLTGYVNILKKYSEVGKSVTALIGEFSRNEVIVGK